LTASFKLNLILQSADYVTWVDPVGIKPKTAK